MPTYIQNSKVAVSNSLYFLVTCRSWQELGYLIIYITGRPDQQKDYILNFLGCHGFPLGLMACAETFTADSQSVKTAFLGRLIKEASPCSNYCCVMTNISFIKKASPP